MLFMDVRYGRELVDMAVPGTSRQASLSCMGGMVGPKPAANDPDLSLSERCIHTEEPRRALK